MLRKILFGAGLLALITIAVAPGIWKTLTDAVRINALAQRIASFELPEGYQPDYAVEILDYTIVAYKSVAQRGHLAFLQTPPGVIPTGTVLEGYLVNNTAAHTWREASVLRTETRTIRDQSATMTISDRINGEGQRYRSLNLVFEGRDGTTLLAINQPETQWNDEAIEAFIASIS